ncbi:MAG: hypothetical protein J0H40_12390 [Rhizobiales bacterium]|nr:hypothetical protein [Hyphomicrobiales bacterium]
MTYDLSSATASREDVLASYNLGAQTLTMRLPIARFIDMSDVPNDGAVDPDEVSQRPLDKNHAGLLAQYILKGLVHAAANLRKAEGKDSSHHEEVLKVLGPQRYYALQPIVVNLPVTMNDLKPQKQVNPAGDEISLRIGVSHSTLMWVVDGQHRRYAMNTVLDFLRNVRATQAYPKRGSLFPGKPGEHIPPAEMEVWRDALQLALNYCTVTIEAHLNLDAEQRRQLFADLNNKGKSVSASMAFDFDNSNPVNVFIKDTLMGEGILTAPVVEKDIVEWSNHDGSMARKDLVAINSILILNKTNPRGAVPSQVDKMEDTARRFWEAVSSISGFGEAKAKLNTVAAQPVVLKALAKLTYDFAMSKKSDEVALEELLDGIPNLDFSHNNPMWRAYEMTAAERQKKLPGLSDYLPHDNANRDLGSTDTKGLMRFGAKHNDIYPVLGDIIRWKLKLPNRHEDEAVENAA